MTKDIKVKLLQVILNAGIKGADREMLDNLKAVIKAIENEDVAVKVEKIGEEHLEKEAKAMLTPFKRKAGRPKKR